jgi:hypothetical protein
MPNAQLQQKAPRERLGTVRNGLLHLHRALLHSERAVYERDVERVTSTYHMLELVMNDPWFDWLHEISRLIVHIDEVLGGKNRDEVSTGEADQIIAHAGALVMPAEHGNSFKRRYFEAMQRDPEVILAHRQFTKVLQTVA